jgi:hypothetical protein
MIENSKQDTFKVAVAASSLTSSYQKQVDDDAAWTTEYLIDQLYIEMCEVQKVQANDPSRGPQKEYYIKAGRYAGRVSLHNNFEAKENKKYKPVFEINPCDFSPRVQAELKSLLKTSPDTLRRVVQGAVSRIFKARHKMIFYQYIENEGVNRSFVVDVDVVEDEGSAEQ